MAGSGSISGPASLNLALARSLVAWAAPAQEVQSNTHTAVVKMTRYLTSNSSKTAGFCYCEVAEVLFSVYWLVLFLNSSTQEGRSK